MKRLLIVLASLILFSCGTSQETTRMFETEENYNQQHLP
jgi:outer membrane biogenesis lipoprotein LolB